MARAFPPAPHHLIYGMVRDELGNPLIITSAEVLLETGSGTLIKTSIAPGLEPGANYRLTVPMDAGLTSDLYKPTALQPTVPFKIKVRIGPTLYLPIEMNGDYSKLGRPGQTTRLDLTLGEDSDGDGLPDAWERMLLAARGGGSLNEIRPGDDTDGDGLSNVNEYVAGTYAFDAEDGFTLQIIGLESGAPLLEFMAIRGRTYSIAGSSDLQQWTPLSFRIPAEGPASPSRSNYQASDVRTVRVQVTEPGSQSLRFFKLLLR